MRQSEQKEVRPKEIRAEDILAAFDRTAHDLDDQNGEDATPPEPPEPSPSGPSQKELLCALSLKTEHLIPRKNTHLKEGDDFKPGKVYDTCAVVSNSGVMLAHNTSGKEIDEADLVIRFNNAPTGTFFTYQDGEQVQTSFSIYVGKKEGLRVINDEVTRKWEDYDWGNAELKKKDITWIVRPNYTTDEPDVLLANITHAHHHAAVYSLDAAVEHSFIKAMRELYAPNWFDSYWFAPDLDYLTVSEIEKRKPYMRPDIKEEQHRPPTSGATGILLALNMCKEVRAYGLAASYWGIQAPYHYYNQRKKRAMRASWHATFLAEKDLWRKVAKNSGSHIDQTDKAVIPGFPSDPCKGFKKSTILAKDYSMPAPRSYMEWLYNTIQDPPTFRAWLNKTFDPNNTISPGNGISKSNLSSCEVPGYAQFLCQ